MRATLQGVRRLGFAVVAVACATAGALTAVVLAGNTGAAGFLVSHDDGHDNNYSGAGADPARRHDLGHRGGRDDTR